MAVVSWNKNSKQWEARIQRNGIRRRFYSDRPGIRGKQEVLQQIRDFENGFIPHDVTIGELWPSFLEDVAARSSVDNVRNTELIGRLYILPTMSDRIIDDVTINDWQTLINSATGKSGKVLAAKSLQNIRGVISSFARFCFRGGYIPTAELNLYIPKGHPTYSKTILQPDQIRALFSDDYDDHFINAWRLMLLTGLRPGEALGLQWSDISNGLIGIHRSINRAGRLTEGKNTNAQRLVPVSAQVRDVLNYQKERTASFDSPWIFCSIVGAMPSQSSAFKSFKRTVTAIGAPDCSMYSLRHTFVSIMQNSIPEAMLKRIVGHSENMDTYGVYAHPVNGDELQIASALESVLAPLTARIAPNSSRDDKSEKLSAERQTAQITPLSVS